MMAEAPKSTKKNTPKAPATGGKAVKDPKAKVEDAVVIGETPPKSAKAAKTPPATHDKPPAEAAKQKPVLSKAEAAARVEEATKPGTNSPTTKPVETPKAEPAAPARKRSGAFAGFVLGGVVAALIGFAAARTIVPEGWPFPGVEPEVDPLVNVIETQGAEIAALGARVDDRFAALDARLAEMQADTSALDKLRSDMTARLDGLATGAGQIAERLDAMEARLSSVEKLAPEGTEAAKTAAAAYARELEALTGVFEDQLEQMRAMFAGELETIHAAQAEATALEAQLAASSREATAQAALAQVLAALDTGGKPFETPLLELAQATGTDAPAALAQVAADGVPGLGALRDAFPEAARLAIDADIRASVEDGSLNRVEAFMRTQLGTRSLAPKEGDDADAVLSRAEAALKQGDLATALAELDSLPEAAKPALAEWRQQAEARANALAAGAALADQLNTK